MVNQPVSSPNDFKVVDFKNTTDFDFTPEMGCMYDSRPISGLSGKAGVVAGEKLTLPYHIGHRLAINLAKQVMVREDNGNPPKDALGNPMVRALWGEERVAEVAKTFITDLYAESKPIAQSETDKLMAKVEEYKAMVEKVVGAQKPAEAPKAPVAETTVEVAEPQALAPKTVFQDKAEVIAELAKRGVPHDKRKSKAELEKLLT